MRGNPRTSKRGLYGAPDLSARVSRREGDFWIGVEVEVGGEAVFGGEIDGRCRLVGVIDAGQPFVGRLESLRGEAQGLEQEVGALEVDHVGGDGLDELIDRREHGGHGLNRRQFQVEAFHAGAGLGRAKLTGAIAQMKGAIVAVFDGDGVASAAGVVEMIASFVGHRSPRTVSSFAKIVLIYRIEVSSNIKFNSVLVLDLARDTLVLKFT